MITPSSQNPRKDYVAGSAVLDLLAPLSGELPRLGEQALLGGSPKSRLGGPGAAGGVTIARLNDERATTNLVARIPDDSTGTELRNLALSVAPGLKLPLPASSQLGTSYTWILTSPTAERTFLHYPGANAELSAKDVADSLGGCSEGSIALFAGIGIVPSLQGNNLAKAVRGARERGCFVGVSTQAPRELFSSEALEWIQDAAQYADVMVLSDKDTHGFVGVGRDRPRDAVERVIQLGTGVAMVTLGEKGALLGYCPSARIKEITFVEIPGYKVTAKDTTGCGDCAGAAFVHQLANGVHPEEAGKFACAVGALIASRGMGAHGAPTLSEVRQFMAASGR